MKNAILKKILLLGTDKELNTLDYWRVLLVNRMVLVAISICLFLMVNNALSNLVEHSIISLVAIVLLLPIFYLNHLRKFKFASIYFILLCTSAICLASHLAYIGSRFTDTELLLIFFLVITIFLLDGLVSKLIFLIISIELFVLKYEKSTFQELDFDNLFYLLFINVSTLILGLYAFSTIFKGFLIKSLLQTETQTKVLYALIDNVPSFIGIYDNKGKYIMVNKKYEASYFMTREEIIGNKLKNVLPKESVKVYEPMLKKALKGKEVEFYEKTLMKDGSYIIGNGKYVPVYDENGNVEYVTITVNDVTKLEDIRLELVEANRGKDRLLGIVAHDVKGPLNNFESLLKIGEEGMFDKAEFSEIVKKLKTQFVPIKQMVEQLLAWSLVQMKNQESKLEDQRLVDIVKGILEMLNPDIIAKRLKVELTGTVNPIFADKNHLSIIFRNILHNAVKFTPVDGEIKMNFKNESGLGVVEVSDNGVGMDNDLIKHILHGDLVESSLGTSKEKGTGLGLSLCVDLLKKNNGSMEIDSKVGIGSTFRIKLPIH